MKTFTRDSTSVGGPTRGEKLEILRSQAWRCLYCQLSFWSWEIYDIKRDTKFLPEIEWDHFVPWKRTRSHSGQVAACSICNKHKSGNVFNSVEEIRKYLLKIWTNRYRQWKLLDSGLATFEEKPFNEAIESGKVVIPDVCLVPVWNYEEDKRRNDKIERAKVNKIRGWKTWYGSLTQEEKDDRIRRAHSKDYV